MLIVSDKEIPQSVLQELDAKTINSECDICDDDTVYYIQTSNPKYYKKYATVILVTEDELKGIKLQRSGDINSYFLLNENYIKNFKDSVNIVKTRNKIHDSLAKMCSMVSNVKFVMGV